MSLQILHSSPSPFLSFSLKKKKKRNETCTQDLVSVPFIPSGQNHLLGSMVLRDPRLHGAAGGVQRVSQGHFAQVRGRQGLAEALKTMQARGQHPQGAPGAGIWGKPQAP